MDLLYNGKWNLSAGDELDKIYFLVISFGDQLCSGISIWWNPLNNPLTDSYRKTRIRNWPISLKGLAYLKIYPMRPGKR
jgi:hypothetical protein